MRWNLERDKKGGVRRLGFQTLGWNFGMLQHVTILSTWTFEY
jgi:hypothetical protein